MGDEKTGPGYGPLEFTARRFQLIALADWALAAIPSGSTALAVNGCFRVSVAPDRLSLAGAGQRVSVFADTAAVSAATVGEVHLPARKLRAMLGEAEEGDVTVTVKGGHATVSASGAVWSLRLPPTAGYIGLPDLSQAQFSPVSRDGLLSALTAVRHAVGREANRPTYTQVRIAESDGEMYACAVEGGGQFSRAPVPGFPMPLLIPGAVLDDLVKLLAKSPADGVVEVADADPYVVFRVPPVTMAALKTSDAFPDVEAMHLRPLRGHDQVLTVDKADLTRALRQVRITADPTTSAVALIADSSGPKARLTVESRDADGNSAEKVIPVAEWAGGHRLVVVNGGFLEAMLAVHPSPVCSFRLGPDQGKARSPLLLEDPAAKIMDICQQMSLKLVGYKEK
jgi:DNA polymerase III sliding clamp (beta) subunit (PCNA family)